MIIEAWNLLLDSVILEGTVLGAKANRMTK